MARKSDNIIPNQVFIGCPWRQIRPKYNKVLSSLKNKYPIHFVIIGNEEDQHAEDLYGLIRSKIESSSKAIFDATGGNANVSLEFGYAEASGIECTLYINAHGAHQKKTERTIISDLAGKRYKTYKNEKSLTSLLDTFCKIHPFTIRFEQLLDKACKGRRGPFRESYRRKCLAVLDLLSNGGSMRRNDLIQKLQAQKYEKSEIEELLDSLKGQDIIYVARGNPATVYVI